MTYAPSHPAFHDDAGAAPTTDDERRPAPSLTATERDREAEHSGAGYALMPTPSGRYRLVLILGTVADRDAAARLLYRLAGWAPAGEERP